MMLPQKTTLGTLRNRKYYNLCIFTVASKQKNMMLKRDGRLKCTFSGKVQQGLLNCISRQTNCIESHPTLLLCVFAMALMYTSAHIFPRINYGY